MSLKQWFKNLLTPASVKKELADLRVMLNEANEHTLSAYRDVELIQLELEETKRDVTEHQHSLQVAQRSLTWYKDEHWMLEKRLKEEKQKVSDVKSDLVYATNRINDYECQIGDLEAEIADLQDQLYDLENELQESRWSE